VLAWFNKAYTLEMMGRMEGSLAAFDKVLGLDPGDASAMYCRARLLALLGRSDEALEQLKKVLELNPDSRGEAKEDVAFDKLRGDERFTKLVG